MDAEQMKLQKFYLEGRRREIESEIEDLNTKWKRSKEDIEKYLNPYHDFLTTPVEIFVKGRMREFRQAADELCTIAVQVGEKLKEQAKIEEELKKFKI